LGHVVTPALILFAAAVVIPGIATRAVTTVVNPCPLFRHAGLCVVTKQEQLAELVEQSNLFRFVSRGRVAKFNISYYSMARGKHCKTRPPSNFQWCKYCEDHKDPRGFTNHKKKCKEDARASEQLTNRKRRKDSNNSPRNRKKRHLDKVRWISSLMFG
jgi:hypothetical protein